MKFCCCGAESACVFRGAASLCISGRTKRGIPSWLQRASFSRAANATTYGGDVQIPYRADAVKSVFQSCEGGALGQEHEEAVKAFIEVGVAFWFEELEAQVSEDGGLEELHEFVDLDEHGERHFQVCEDLQEEVRLFVGLGEETEGEGGDGVVGPGAEEGGEEDLAVLHKRWD